MDIGQWETINEELRRSGESVTAVTSTIAAAHRDSEATVHKYNSGAYSTRPFEANASKVVLLLGYQRCGSTFTGGLFNQNGNAFYMFEPVDGIYSSMYGSRPGFNVPSDIFNYWNGTEREVPEMETRYVADVMTSLMSCDFQRVPTEVLLHRFMFLFQKQHEGLASYKQCIIGNDITIQSVNTCWNNHLKGFCVDRFGSSPEKEELCRKGLLEGAKGFTQKEMSAFKGYKDCLRELRYAFDACEPFIADLCTSADVISAKTVRLTMSSAELMLRSLPNLRILHLIRDPRAVVLSRMKDSTYRGKMSRGDLAREASFYCKGVLRDVEVRKRIESKYPGTIMQVIYEDLASNPLQVVGEIYSFLNESVPVDVKNWLVKNTGVNGTSDVSLQIAEKWQDKLTYRMARNVGASCTQLFDAIDFQWPNI